MYISHNPPSLSTPVSNPSAHSGRNFELTLNLVQSLPAPSTWSTFLLWVSSIIYIQRLFSWQHLADNFPQSCFKAYLWFNILQVVLCAAASASPLPFNIGDLLQGPAQHLARAQGRAEHLTEDSYRAPEAGYGVPEASYGAPESQCVCEQEPEKKKKKGEKHGVFGIFDAIGKLFKKEKKEKPKDSYGAPEASYGVPQDSYGVPEDSYGVPVDSYGVPEAGYGVPVESPCVCPSAEYGAPLVAPQATSYEVPEPVYSAPAPVYKNPEPAYGAPEHVYSSPF